MKLFFISALCGWNCKRHRHQTLACAVSRVFTSNCWRREAKTPEHLHYWLSTLLRGLIQLFAPSVHRGKAKACTALWILRGRAPQKHNMLLWAAKAPGFTTASISTASHLNRKAQAAGSGDQGWGRHSRVPSPLLCCCWNELFIIFLPALHPSRAVSQPLASTEIIYDCLMHVSSCDCSFILRSSFLPMVFAASPILSPTSFCWGFI